MEETYWKQFMTTGRVEDYLHFKQVSNIEGKAQKENETGKNRGDLHMLRETRQQTRILGESLLNVTIFDRDSPSGA